MDAPLNVFDATIARLWTAGETSNAPAFIDLLADDVIVRSPITQRIRFEGINQAGDLFRRIFDIISDITMYEVIGQGTSAQVIFWHGTVGDTYLEEANLIRMNDDGKIIEMTVFMRAIPGLLQLTARIAPSLASRKGRARAMMTRVPLTLVSAMYRSGESLILKLSQAGVAVDHTSRPAVRQSARL
jgi:hypothetical protein